MSSPTTAPTLSNSIKVTTQAIQKIYALMKEEGNLALKLRIFITGGGCSGFQYGFSFEEAANEDDMVIPKAQAQASDNDQLENNTSHDPEAAITILVDMLSLPYLTGAEIDYRQDINGEQFIIRNNPNAKTTCGCGSSFSADGASD